LTDEIRAIDHVLVTKGLSGPVNLVAPNAVRNVDYTRVFAKALKRPAIFPAPAFVLRLALGEMADELLLASQHVTPRALQESGFEFAHPDLDGTLRHELATTHDAN
jgi:NAD dependent epimerase/dehydratase family enzyme